MHKSYDPSTGETHYDKFDIDFIRYTRLPNVIANFLGTFLMMLFFISSQSIWNFMAGFSLSALIYILLFGVVFCFLLLFFIARAALGKPGAARLAGRRGLFSFTTITLTVILALIVSGTVHLYGNFGETLKIILASQIFVAFLALPLDYLITFFLKK